MTTRLRNKLATAHDQVVDAYNNGATLRQIGDVHGVSPGTVRNLLRELDVPMRNRGRRRKSVTTEPRLIPTAPVAKDGDSNGTDKYDGGAF